MGNDRLSRVLAILLRPASGWKRVIGRIMGGIAGQGGYLARLEQEKSIYEDNVDVHELPDIFHYWSDKYVRPMLEEVGASNPDQFFARYIRDSLIATSAGEGRIVSIGSGNCDTEVRVAKLLLDMGVREFQIECMDINQAMLGRGMELAQAEGVSAHIRALNADFNHWTPSHRYDAVMANQSLHHVLDLEHLFGAVKDALHPKASFIVSDMIGRNGHQRWPEARREVDRFWNEMPSTYRYNRQLQRQEDTFLDWDCSVEGFEGVRAQDILPLLLDKFSFQAFVGFGNVVDPFVDRSFGHNFDAQGAWDRDFIDRVHACDEEGFRAGHLKPTHMMAVLSNESGEAPRCARGLSPQASCRK